MFWLMAFLRGLAKIRIRDCLPFSPACALAGEASLGKCSGTTCSGVFAGVLATV